MMITFTLPFDRPPLMSNERLHHMAKHRVKQDIRQAGFIQGKRALVGPTGEGMPLPITVPVHVRMVWSVPTRHRRDADCAQPTCKAYLDGLVSAGLVRDDDFQHVPRVYCEIEYAPNLPMSLRVEITPA